MNRSEDNSQCMHHPNDPSNVMNTSLLNKKEFDPCGMNVNPRSLTVALSGTEEKVYHTATPDCSYHLGIGSW